MKKIVSLLIAMCMVLGMIPAANAEGIADYPALTYGVEMQISAGYDSYTYVTFKPETTGSYRFYSVGDVDTRAELYDAQMDYIKGSDDCYAGEEHGHADGNNFCIIAKLEAGATYVLGVTKYGGDVEMTIGVDHAHIYSSEIIQAPTCSEEGSALLTCDVCGYSYTETLGTTACSYASAVTAEPTCDEEGVLTYTCTRCGDSYTRSIAALGHDCGEDRICVRCGEQFPASGTWSDSDGRSLSWSYEAGVLTITGEGEMPALGIRETWDDFVFIDNTPWKELPIREVVIGEGITNVTGGLFEDRTELEKLILPGTLTDIGNRAFRGCSSLNGLELPEELTSIGYEAFEGCSALTAVELPETLDRIGYRAFADCDLRRIHIPAGTTIDRYYPDLFDCFEGNRNLEQITVDGSNPFYCSDDQGVLYTKDMTGLVLVPYAYEGAYVLPAATIKLRGELFSVCPKLNNIEVEAGNAAFYSLDGMLYRSVYSDSYWADNNTIVEYTIENVLEVCPPARALGAYTIDARTGGLSLYAFKNCTGLTELTIPKTCSTNIGHYSSAIFRDIVEGCSDLEAVWFEEGHPDCFSDAEGFVYNAVAHDISMAGRYEAGAILEYVPAARTEAYLEIPEGIQGVAAVLTNPNLRAIRFPSTLRGLANHLLTDCTLDWILFTGDEPTNADMMETEWATNVTAKVYYPDWLVSWKPFYLDVVNCDLTYIPYAQGSEPVWGGEGNPFIDVPADSFYAEPVLWAVEKGITNGLSADSFGPNATCNRAQVVTFLWRAAGSPEPTSTVNPFVDVQAGSFYEKPVLWAVENGITTGSDATHFNPTGECNRAQVVTFMYRTFESPAVSVEGLPFTDVPAGSWYEAPIAWAVANGITNGLDATHFGPNAICNRAQVVTFLYRAFA